MALGAFLAGVLLASSEYRHALETDIEPFKGLLMGLFFIAVGMSIDFGLLGSRPLLLAALVLGFVGAEDGGARAASARASACRAASLRLFAALLSQGGEFAFVVFGVAGAARVLPGEWDKILTLVVALSMVLTPLLGARRRSAAARRRARRSARATIASRREDAPVIIAGFGRFGQIVGRLLFASRLKATVLDHDPDNIDTLRRFGFRVFYGDATRLDLLDAAGAHQAAGHRQCRRRRRCEPAAWSTSCKNISRNLHVIARARNVTHWLELRARGVVAHRARDASNRRCSPAGTRSRRSASVLRSPRARRQLPPP